MAGNSRHRSNGAPPRRVLYVHASVDSSDFALPTALAADTVFLAADGQAGLRAFFAERGNFDLIVSGIVMPHLDGFGFASRIRQLTAIPMVMVDASTLDLHAAAFFAGLAVAHISSAADLDAATTHSTRALDLSS